MTTTTSHLICWPGTTGFVSNSFEMVRTACGEGKLVGEATAVRAVAEGSGPPVTTAVFVGVNVASGASAPVIVQVRELLAGMVAAGQVAVPAVIGQFAPPWSAFIDAAVSPVGI